MKIEEVIVMFFEIGLTVIVGMLVINMITGFLNEGGIVYDFLYDLLEIIVGKITSLIN